MRDFEVKNAKIFWGGPSPPQTPPNNEEGTPPPQTPPLNVGKVQTFCHSSPPTSKSWICHCVLVLETEKTLHCFASLRRCKFLKSFNNNNNNNNNTHICYTSMFNELNK